MTPDKGVEMVASSIREDKNKQGIWINIPFEVLADITEDR
jgi:hypothetical protein